MAKSPEGKVEEEHQEQQHVGSAVYRQGRVQCHLCRNIGEEQNEAPVGLVDTGAPHPWISVRVAESNHHDDRYCYCQVGEGGVDET